MITNKEILKMCISVFFTVNIVVIILIMLGSIPSVDVIVVIMIIVFYIVNSIVEYSKNRLFTTK